MKMKVLTCLMIALVFSLMGCESKDTGISIEEYSTNLEDIIRPYETHIEEYFNFTLFQMIDVVRYEKYYSNVKLSQNLEETINLLEQMQIGLSEVGTDFKDESLLSYQSNIEIALEEMKQTYKIDSEKNSFTSNFPSQFTLYTDTYKMMKSLSISQQTYYENVFLLMEAIQDKGVEVNPELLRLLGENRLRFNHIYTVLTTQVSTYQDFVGMLVSPMRSEFQLWEDKFYRVSELDPVAMNALVSYLEEEVSFLDKHIIVEDTVKNIHLDYSQNIIDAYNSYLGIRLQLSSDFFVSGDYRDYQKLTKNTLKTRLDSIGIIELDFYGESYYTFDTEKYTDYNFDILDEMYLKLQRVLFNSDHQTMLFYEKRELDAFEKNE